MVDTVDFYKSREGCDYTELNGWFTLIRRQFQSKFRVFKPQDFFDICHGIEHLRFIFCEKYKKSFSPIEMSVINGDEAFLLLALKSRRYIERLNGYSKTSRDDYFIGMVFLAADNGHIQLLPILVDHANLWGESPHYHLWLMNIVQSGGVDCIEGFDWLLNFMVDNDKWHQREKGAALKDSFRRLFLVDRKTNGDEDNQDLLIEANGFIKKICSILEFFTLDEVKSHGRFDEIQSFMKKCRNETIKQQLSVAMDAYGISVPYECVNSGNQSQDNSQLDVIEVFSFSDGFRPSRSEYIELRELQDSRKHLKKLRKITDDTIEAVERLKTQFPNFKEIIDYLVDSFTMSSFGKGFVYFEPIFLLGAPGIGKTEFVYALTAVLELEILKFNVASMQTNATLAGTDPHWSNASPGKLSSGLLSQSEPNFIVFLDEIDKVIQRPGNGGDPLSSLYDLLEKTSASTFVDGFYGVQVSFNASFINFIASGNTTDTLHPAIVSRFNVFEVSSPSYDEAKIIAKNIHRSLLIELGLNKKIGELSDDVLELLVDFEPREIKKLLKRGYASSLRSGDKHLVKLDFEVAIRQIQSRNVLRIGFY